MDTKKLTVLVISNDDNEVKSFQISANLIKNYKKYLKLASGLIAVCVILITAIVGYSFKLGYSNNSLTSQINAMNRELETYDSLKLTQKLNTIDNNLAMINSYLHERGMMGGENAGGELISRDKRITNGDNIDYFTNQSVVFYNTVKGLPIGLPYYGEMSSDYGYRRNPFGGYNGEFHPGIDFKGDIGDPVYATGEGIVERCDWYGGYGNAIVIQHTNGFKALFGHLSRINVAIGQQIKAGDLIGYIGSTGRSTGPHLHYEIRKNEEDINPEPFLKLY